MKLLLFFALTMIIMVNVTQGQGQGGRRAPQFGGRGGGGQRGRNCICPNDFRPVCGSNYITYGNRCQLNCEQRHNSCKNIKFKINPLQIIYFSILNKPLNNLCIIMSLKYFIPRFTNR